MELQALLEIERISTPDIRLVEILKTDAVTIKGETLHFKNSGGVFTETRKKHTKTLLSSHWILFPPWQ